MPSDESLDPEDWAQFRRVAHAALDDCIDYLARVRERAVWQPPPAEALALMQSPLPAAPAALEQVLDDVRWAVLPYATGNTHPRFFGWVHGAGTPLGVVAEMLAATMNSNCGGREHAAIHVERQVIDWARTLFGFPAGSSGVLTVGTSMATVIALAAARAHRLGERGRLEGNAGSRRLVGYCSAEAHVAITKAFELLGLGSAHLRAIPVDAHFTVSTEALERSIRDDRASGLEPFLLVGTAGTVNTGSFDDLAGLARVAAREGLWYHVDGAFGAWVRIADSPWRELAHGIELADSLAFDFHKWISVPYDAGCVLVRDRQAHRAAFAGRPHYLEAGARGLAGGEPWPCDYGIDLSRGFRALKIWMTLRHFGFERLGRMVTRNCRSARYLAEAIARSADFELAAPVTLNVCCFGLRHRVSLERENQLVAALVEQLQLSGVAAPSTTRLGGRLCVRVAILNHRTVDADLDALLEASTRILREISSDARGAL